MPSLVIVPVKCERKFGKFDLGKTVARCIADEGLTLKERDVVVVSSKFASMAEGRYLKLGTLKISKRGKDLSERYRIDPSLAELVVQESDSILGGIPGFALAVTKGVLAPNAGIDRSNIESGYAIFYPSDPAKTARKLQTYLAKSFTSKLGVILSDSRISPLRQGTTGVAIATAGFEPVVDCRGNRDLFGNELKVTMRAVADQIASAAQLVTGEGAESIPVALVRGWNGRFGKGPFSIQKGIAPEKCLYVQGLQNPL